MKIRTFTLREKLQSWQSRNRVKRTIDVVADHVVSLHDVIHTDGPCGTAIALDTGETLRVEEGRHEIRAWLENE